MNLRLISSILFLSLAASGCRVIPGTESTVADTRSNAPRPRASAQSPALSTKCIIKNIENRFGDMHAIFRDSSRPDVIEVQVRSVIGVAAIIEVEPVGAAGSLITTRVSNHYINKDAMTDTFTKDC